MADAPRIVLYRGCYLKEVVRVLGKSLLRENIGESLFVRKVLLDPNYVDGAVLVALRGEAVAGAGTAFVRRVPLEDAPMDSDRGYVTLLATAPEYRREGIGSALLGALEESLRERGATTANISPYAPGYFTPGVDVEASAEGLAFLLRRGYAEVYRPIAMERELGDAAPPTALADRIARLPGEGVAVCTYRPEHLDALLQFAREAFRGDWQRFLKEAAGDIALGDDPGRLQIALRNDRAIGFSHYAGERFGPIGVAAEERGKGIGQALLFATLGAMRAQGLRRAFFLWSDDRTAEHFYNGAGFQIFRRFAVLRKELAEHSATTGPTTPPGREPPG